MTSTSSTSQSGTSKTWELSLYELNREPQDVVTDETEIKVSPRTLHSELMCPICLDLLKKTMTTKECLHRFCSECIITALRSGNKECPTCRKKLASKRSLRSDPNFDSLIETLYPNREEYEAHQIKVMEKFNKSQSQAALVHSINEGIKIQSQTRSQRINKRSQNDDGNIENHTTEEPQPSTSSSRNSQNDNNTPTSSIRSNKKMKNSENKKCDKETKKESINDFNNIELIFKPHPMETDKFLFSLFKDELTKFIKTSPDATVEYVSKNYFKKVSKDGSFDNIRLKYSIQDPSGTTEYIVLNGKETLKNISEIHWKSNRPLELYVSKKT